MIITKGYSSQLDLWESNESAPIMTWLAGLGHAWHGPRSIKDISNILKATENGIMKWDRSFILMIVNGCKKCVLFKHMATGKNQHSGFSIKAFLSTKRQSQRCFTLIFSMLLLPKAVLQSMSNVAQRIKNACACSRTENIDNLNCNCIRAGEKTCRKVAGERAPTLPPVRTQKHMHLNKSTNLVAIPEDSFKYLLALALLVWSLSSSTTHFNYTQHTIKHVIIYYDSINYSSVIDIVPWGINKNSFAWAEWYLYPFFHSIGVISTKFIKSCGRPFYNLTKVLALWQGRCVPAAACSQPDPQGGTPRYALHGLTACTPLPQ